MKTRRKSEVSEKKMGVVWDFESLRFPGGTRGDAEEVGSWVEEPDALRSTCDRRAAGMEMGAAVEREAEGSDSVC